MVTEISRKIELQKHFALNDFRNFLIDNLEGDIFTSEDVEPTIRNLLKKIENLEIPFSFYGWFTKEEMEYFEADIEAYSLNEEELQERHRKTKLW